MELLEAMLSWRNKKNIFLIEKKKSYLEMYIYDIMIFDSCYVFLVMTVMFHQHRLHQVPEICLLEPR